ncbi:MAG TPA: hypothetical protein VFC07_08500, partial [Verrucomicrobiae bacterium]|nr:hypothetical protein [Verrucomicrobiae bacterium]
MKTINLIFSLWLILLTACSSTPIARDPQHSPETVMITYHVKPGMDVVLQDALARAWVIYRKENLVFAQPHTIVQDQSGGGGGIRIIEIFTWVNHAAPEHVPDSVKQIWAEMQGLCQ